MKTNNSLVYDSIRRRSFSRANFCPLSSRNVDRESRSVSSLSDDAAIKESAIRHCRVGRSIKLYEPLDGQLRDPIHHNAYARKA